MCVLPSLENNPICYCNEAWTGTNCEIPKVCQSFCSNQGQCILRDGFPYCSCTEGYTGVKCEILPKDLYATIQDQSHSILVPILSAIAVVIIVLVLGFFAFDYFFKSRTFTHVRLQENDFNNPIYQDRDAEPFRLDPDKVCWITFIAKLPFGQYDFKIFSFNN